MDQSRAHAELAARGSYQLLGNLGSASVRWWKSASGKSVDTLGLRLRVAA